jgi:hypothetical protein
MFVTWLKTLGGWGWGGANYSTMGIIFYLPLDKILDVHIPSFPSLPTTHSSPQVMPVLQAIFLLPKHDFSKLELQKWKSMRQCRIMSGNFCVVFVSMLAVPTKVCFLAFMYR